MRKKRNRKIYTPKVNNKDKRKDETDRKGGKSKQNGMESKQKTKQKTLINRIIKTEKGNNK